MTDLKEAIKLAAREMRRPHEDADDALNNLRDALAFLFANGYQVVPRELTDKMQYALIAPRGYTIDGYPNTHHVSDKWKAVLAAAQAEFKIEIDCPMLAARPKVSS